VPSLRRRSRTEETGPAGVEPAVPWALTALLRDGAAPLAARPRRDPGAPLDAAVVLAPGTATAATAGLPSELLLALGDHGVVVREVEADHGEAAAAADVVLAAGWPAAPAVLTLAGVRARAVLATAEDAPLADRGWTAGVSVLAPSWLGGVLPPGADAAYAPLPVHRREDLVLVHGEDPLGLLAAAELHARRPALAFAVGGARAGLVLPFPFLGVEPGAAGLAHAFASATVALAPPVRGWRPAAVAMLACGQAVVAPAGPAADAALGDAAALVTDPLAAADAALALIDDLSLRADRVRAGFARVPGGWAATAAALAADLRALAA
jgi:hypothetical protein